ncbi:CaiB/BaiF CoA transferase family protein [Novispirillum sp. DQ9]|uniref:CaiB/BaiF CoA transferase family protein n=1 Tax=Novispirillum sp. DQ9 TaxID=3398612 RepID=UPI003C7C82D9
MAGPLSHIRVLDLSRVLAGPWAGQLLADLGAEVIKIERPGAGDDTREWGPPYLRGADGQPTTESAYYLSCNRGKKSVAVDMASADGQRVIRDLAARSDIVLENFKVGGLKKYGLDYDSLKAVKPDLIYCSITGFGQSGPYAPRAGYDFMIQAMGGLMSLTGEPEGMPTKVGVAFADIFTGMYATVGVLAALAHRDRTGEGQHVDMALLDVQVAVLANQAMNYLTSGTPPARMGNAHPNIVPYQAFATQDGHMILAVGNDGQFKRFCAVAGRPEIAADARFATNADRVRNRAELVPLVAAMMAARTTDEWIAALEPEAVPCGPINTLDRVFADPQVRHRGMVSTLPHPTAGTVDLVSCPIKYSATPAGADTAPPLLGQHTDAVLRDLLGLDDSALASLRAAGVL